MSTSVSPTPSAEKPPRDWALTIGSWIRDLGEHTEPLRRRLESLQSLLDMDCSEESQRISAEEQWAADTIAKAAIDELEKFKAKLSKLDELYEEAQNSATPALPPTKPVIFTGTDEEVRSDAMRRITRIITGKDAAFLSRLADRLEALPSVGADEPAEPAEGQGDPDDDDEEVTRENVLDLYSSIAACGRRAQAISTLLEHGYETAESPGDDRHGKLVELYIQPGWTLAADLTKELAEVADVFDGMRTEMCRTLMAGTVE